MFKRLVLLLVLSSTLLALSSIESFQRHKLQKVFSKVGKSPFPVDSFHGYVKVDNQGSDIFYWLFPAKTDPENAPLLVWFTGGPGCSSELAVMFENGPFNITKAGELQLNPYSWNDKAHLLYIDQPVGTGHSHAAIRDMSVTEAAMAANMLTFFRRFYEDLFPKFQNKKLFLSGESFAGNYLPHISRLLVESAPAYINFQGVAIGNGWTNPPLQYTQAAKFAITPENVKYTNLTQDQFNKIQPNLDMCLKVLPQAPAFLKPRFDEFCGHWNGKILGRKNINMYDIRKTCDYPLCYDLAAIGTFLNSDRVRNELQADKSWVPCNGLVGGVIARLEFAANAAPQLVPVLEKGLPVLVYSGEYDFACNWMGGDAWTKDLQWSGQSEFVKQEMVPEGKYGSSRVYKNFKFVRFFESGHMVPYDQPQYALEMINKFMGFN